MGLIGIYDHGCLKILKGKGQRPFSGNQKHFKDEEKEINTVKTAMYMEHMWRVEREENQEIKKVLMGGLQEPGMNSKK